MTKVEHYKSGKWACSVPPVCTAYWDDQAWINWINRNGVWL